MTSAEEQRATWLTLYPLFKQEVYHRREQIMRWTAVGAGTLFTFLSALLLISEPGRLSPAARTLLACAVLLLACTFASLIVQQQQRHRQAKQILIDLETALGLYDEGPGVRQPACYPDHWRSDWKNDTATRLSLILLGLFTLLALAATIWAP